MLAEEHRGFLKGGVTEFKICSVESSIYIGVHIQTYNWSPALSCLKVLSILLCKYSSSN
jgi:hypothetical protein